MSTVAQIAAAVAALVHVVVWVCEALGGMVIASPGDRSYNSPSRNTAMRPCST